MWIKRKSESLFRPGSAASPEASRFRFVSKWRAILWLPLGGSKPLWLAIQTTHLLLRQQRWQKARRPINFDGSMSTPLSGSPAVAKHYLKHRSTQNFSPVFNMWNQARASLGATALMATMPFRLDLFR
jgi:hypothetical protein